MMCASERVSRFLKGLAVPITTFQASSIRAATTRCYIPIYLGDSSNRTTKQLAKQT